MCNTRFVFAPVLIAVVMNVAAGAQAQDVTFDQATVDASYDRWHGGRREPRLVRALLWDATIIGLGTTWYWLEKDLNSLDWDYPTAWQRINGEAVRFDNNQFRTNCLGHPIAGLGYYAMARVSGLEPWQAAVAAFLSSAVWEWGLEWREQVSVNDQFFTPVGGVALGEMAFQLGEYLNSAPGGGGWAQHIAGATLGFPRWVHDRFDDASAPDDLPADELGFSSAWSHRFRLGWEWQHVQDGRDEAATMNGVRAEIELVSMPGFMKPGSFQRTFSHGNFSELTLRTGGSHAAGNQLDLRAQTTLAGVYSQAVSGTAGSDVHGVGAMVGVSTALRHTSGTVLGSSDQVGVASIVGPTVDVRIAAGGLEVRLGADLHADFAAVDSTAYEDWQQGEDTKGLRSVLTKQGYYYGYGFSTQLRAEVAFEGLEVGGRVGYGTWRSIEGLDREQQPVTRDLRMADQALEYEAWVGFTVPSTPINLRLTTSGETRTGSMGEVTGRQHLRRYGAVAGLSF